MISSFSGFGSRAPGQTFRGAYAAHVSAWQDEKMADKQSYLMSTLRSFSSDPEGARETAAEEVSNRIYAGHDFKFFEGLTTAADSLVRTLSNLDARRAVAFDDDQKPYVAVGFQFYLARREPVAEYLNDDATRRVLDNLRQELASSSVAVEAIELRAAPPRNFSDEQTSVEIIARLRMAPITLKDDEARAVLRLAPAPAPAPARSALERAYFDRFTEMEAEITGLSEGLRAAYSAVRSGRHLADPRPYQVLDIYPSASLLEQESALIARTQDIQELHATKRLELDAAYRQLAGEEPPDPRGPARTQQRKPQSSLLAGWEGTDRFIR